MQPKRIAYARVSTKIVMRLVRQFVTYAMRVLQLHAPAPGSKCKPGPVGASSPVLPKIPQHGRKPPRPKTPAARRPQPQSLPLERAGIGSAAAIAGALTGRMQL
jgi:hypothetical protein